MKQISILFFTLIALLISENTYAFRGYYEPLFDSSWAQTHPGQLPYSECYIARIHHFHLGKVIQAPFFNYPEPVVGGYSMGLIVGGTLLSKQKEQLFLSCVSDELGYAYSIPLAMGNMLTIGKVGFSIEGFQFKVLPGTLNGKTLKDLMGQYEGSEESLNLIFMGKSIGQFTNSGTRVKLSMQSFSGIGSGQITLGYTRFKIKPRKTPVHPSQTNTYIITSNTVAADDFMRSEPYKIVPELLEKLQFVRDQAPESKPEISPAGDQRD